MRVIQVIDTLNPGGAERIAVMYTNALQEHIEASFLCVTRQEDGLKGQVTHLDNYLFINKKNAFDLSAIRRFIKFLKAQKIDLVHAHTTSYFFVFLAKLIYPKFIFVWHDHHGNRTSKTIKNLFLLKPISLSFNKIITVNIELKEWAKRNLFCKNVSYLPNFIFTDRKEKQKITLPGQEGKRIICLANLRSAKDHMVLLQSFLSISEDFPDWTLHLVGKDYNDVYAEALKVFIRENEMEKRVHIYGSRNDVFDILHQSDIGVLSSKSEGFPMALLEYGAANLAVISTNVGQCKTIIPSDSFGYLVPPGDSIAMANAIKELIKDKQLRLQLGKHLKERVEAEFGVKKGIKKLINMYESIS